jgi:hypothetical protein
MKVRILLAMIVLVAAADTAPVWAKDRCQLSDSQSKTACAKSAPAKSTYTRQGRSEAEVYDGQLSAPAGH